MTASNISQTLQHLAEQAFEGRPRAQHIDIGRELSKFQYGFVKDGDFKFALDCPGYEPRNPQQGESCNTCTKVGDCYRRFNTSIKEEARIIVQQLSAGNVICFWGQNNQRVSYPKISLITKTDLESHFSGFDRDMLQPQTPGTGTGRHPAAQASLLGDIELQFLGGKDDYVFEHSLRVQKVVRLLTRHSDVWNPSVRALVESIRVEAEEAAYLHDLGKIATPNHLLNIEGALTPMQQHQVNRHAHIGAYLAQLSGLLNTWVALAILFHHMAPADMRELSDLFLDGIKIKHARNRRKISNKLYLMTALLKLADSFDSMRSKRSYSPYSRNTQEVVAKLILELLMMPGVVKHYHTLENGDPAKTGLDDCIAWARKSLQDMIFELHPKEDAGHIRNLARRMEGFDGHWADCGQSSRYGGDRRDLPLSNFNDKTCFNIVRGICTIMKDNVPELDDIATSLPCPE